MPDPVNCPQDWPPEWSEAQNNRMTSTPSSPDYGSNAWSPRSPTFAPHPHSPVPHNQVIGERVMALEVGHMHLTETVRAHNARLSQGDSRMNHHAQEIRNALNRAATAHQALARLEPIPAWIAAEEKRRADAQAAKDDRRTARREALALVQYVVAIALVVSAALGWVSQEQMEAAKSALALKP